MAIVVEREGSMGWLKFILKWGLFEYILKCGYSFVKKNLTMRKLEVPGVIMGIKELKAGNLIASPDFHHVDVDIDRGISYNLKTPSSGRYIIVLFDCSDMVSTFEILLTAVPRLWKLANLSEAIEVGQSFNPKELGLGDNFSLVAPGTVIRRKSATFAICCPVVGFQTIEKEGKRERRTSIYLHSLFSHYSGGHYILFRVG